MNQDSYINIVEDSKWYELDLANNVVVEKNETKSSDNSENSLKNFQTQLQQQCQLCQVELSVLKYSTIDQDIQLCQNCIQSINTEHQCQSEIVLQYSNDSRTRKIITSDKFKLYNLIYGQCLNCLDENVILCKVGRCNHYFCLECLKQRLYEQGDKTYATCLQCEDKLSDYLAIQFIDCYEFIKPKYYCYNRKCTTILSCEPYQDFVPVSVQIQGDNVRCTQCRKQFCGKCWKPHKKQCNIEDLFQQYCKQNKIIQCPSCHVFCERAICSHETGPCRSYQVNNQECPLCNNKFCGDCLGNLELFENQKTEKYLICRSCFAEHQTYKGQVKRLMTGQSIEALIGILFYLIVVTIVLFIILGGLFMFLCYCLVKIFQLITDKVIDKFKQILNTQPRNIVIITAPIWISLIILISIIGFIILFIPMTIWKLKEFYQAY